MIRDDVYLYSFINDSLEKYSHIVFNPNIENFRNFPKYLNNVKKRDKIAIFCTGGIRCEKTSYYLYFLFFASGL